MNMAPLPPLIKGWCPSALRPMETGDGFLVRLRFSGGEVTAEQCRSIAHLARQYGNALIDLSQKGNLQLRGVSAETLPALTASLYGSGLLDADMRHDSICNVIGSPLAGLDPTASIDGHALVRELEAALAADRDLDALPDKFCFLVDEGGSLGLDGVAADVRLIGINGLMVIAVASGRGEYVPIAWTNEAQAGDAALALARAFLTLSGRIPARRMDQLVQAVGAAEIARAAGFAHTDSLPSLPARIAEASDVIGAHASFIGAAAPFGRLDAGQLDLLASLAPNGLRLAPWRCVLLPGAAAEALAPLECAGLIVSADDTRLAIAACPGRPACGSAQIDTRLAAEALAPLARRWAEKGIALHISGCSKGCASPAPAPVTLVGREGAFDIVLNGRADAAPAYQGLALHDVRSILSGEKVGA
jgi:precorrin-3B synthase